MAEMIAAALMLAGCGRRMLRGAVEAPAKSVRPRNALSCANLRTIHFAETQRTSSTATISSAQTPSVSSAFTSRILKADLGRAQYMMKKHEIKSHFFFAALTAAKLLDDARACRPLSLMSITVTVPS